MAKPGLCGRKESGPLVTLGVTRKPAITVIISRLILLFKQVKWKCVCARVGELRV